MVANRPVGYGHSKREPAAAEDLGPPNSERPLIVTFVTDHDRSDIWMHPILQPPVIRGSDGAGSCHAGSDTRFDYDGFTSHAMSPGG
jgi:hypothetical protein